MSLPWFVNVDEERCYGVFAARCYLNVTVLFVSIDIKNSYICFRIPQSIIRNLQSAIALSPCRKNNYRRLFPKGHSLAGGRSLYRS